MKTRQSLFIKLLKMALLCEDISVEAKRKSVWKNGAMERRATERERAREGGKKFLLPYS